MPQVANDGCLHVSKLSALRQKDVRRVIHYQLAIQNNWMKMKQPTAYALMAFFPAVSRMLFAVTRETWKVTSLGKAQSRSVVGS